jgi:hypothetical protein
MARDGLKHGAASNARISRSKGAPLDSIDFWNLAGRAGRLRREFQGNIYMINYAKWAVQRKRCPAVTFPKMS